MRVLFKQKQWIMMQVIFALMGVLLGMSGILLERDSGAPTGGLYLTLEMMIGGGGLTYFFILLSDLAFNVEYVQGTFFTSLSCGQGRKRWMLKRSGTFYLFVLLQYVIAFLVLWFFAGMVVGHFGLEGVQASESILANTPTSAFLGLTVFSILRVLVFVSFGVFVTTLMPGKLAVGSIAAIAATFVVPSLVNGLSSAYKNSRVLEFIRQSICLAVPAKSWIYAIFWIVLFAWFSAERLQRIELVGGEA